MAEIAGIRFREAGKVFYYDCGGLEVYVGAYVVVETAHGTTVGRVVITPEQVVASELKDEIKPILRLASEEDMERHEQLKEKASQDLGLARNRAAEQELQMSFATAEYDLDGGVFTAYFTAAERVDFRNLVRDLSKELGARVQLLQVGDRDRAKLVDGMDICGQRLCCSSWMTSFPSVSIRMAKEQDLPLNPQKISGVCGRLYCCLTFEYEEYKALRGTLPKVGSFVSTPAGQAKVTNIDFVRERVKLYLTEQNEVVELAATDLKLQHGVTVRPMDLVHKVEGGLRPITEDTQAAEADEAGEPRRRRRRGRGRRNGERAEEQPAAASEPVTEAVVEADGGGEAGEKKRRRRRRRRGRGGSGGDGASEAG
jgi:cell fate regulator YaaT (PSP1 superfamily)